MDDSLSHAAPRSEHEFGALAVPAGNAAHLLDATMLFAPRSGGVKRYLLAKHAWLGEQDSVRGTLVVPGLETGTPRPGLVTVAAVKPPFMGGYRLPASRSKWARIITGLAPDLIEAGDPYIPGHAAQDAGQALGCPVVGFCHSDPVALASLHFGDWAGQAAQEPWARFFARFDLVLAPSRYIAARLADSGVDRVALAPLGVDVRTFHPARADRDNLRAELGLAPDVRLLIFAGRPAREKNLEVLAEAVARLGEPYRLLLVGAGRDLPPQPEIISLGFERDPYRLGRLLASCDAFVHANDKEPFGLVALEALACGLPVVCPPMGGVAELIDEQVGQRAAACTGGAMAEAIEALFARDLGELSLTARRRAVERHSWTQTFRTLLDRYGGLLDRPLRRLPVLNH